MTKSKQGSGTSFFWLRVEFANHLADMSLLDYRQKGIYQELYWLDCNGVFLQKDVKKLSKQLKVSFKVLQELLNLMEGKFVEVGDRIHHVDALAGKEAFEQRSAAAKRSAEARWHSGAPENEQGTRTESGYGRNTDVPQNQQESGCERNANAYKTGCERNASTVQYSKVDTCRPPSPNPSQEIAESEIDFDGAPEAPLKPLRSPSQAPDHTTATCALGGES